MILFLITPPQVLQEIHCFLSLNLGSVKKIVSPTKSHKQILWDNEEKTGYDVTNGHYQS